uniref:Uncharacterized protein n=1 Tax=Labrus bergylta TaxID=56723 RepID=A0A3Q3E423_9LABR
TSSSNTTATSPPALHHQEYAPQTDQAPFQTLATSTSSETATTHHEDDTSPSTSSSSITNTKKGLTTSDDPAQWPNVLGHAEQCILVTRGPIQVKDIVFSQNTEKNPHRFTKENYDMVMKNGEKIQRTWLLYSVTIDSLFGKQDNALTKVGFQNWTSNLMHLEAQHWRGVIHRVIAIICHLAERNQAFRGHTNVLYDPHNGNFLSRVELMAVMNEHLRKIQNKATKVHYLSSQIQNKIIALIGDKILEEIVRKVKRAKLMDCTPDISHTEQLSVVLRVIHCKPSVGASISEHFVGSQHDGQQKALCVPCSSHTLYLVVADAVKSSVVSISFFGVLQRLYNLFSSSLQCWAVLQEHVKQLTVKSLSVTRWEAWIDSVKVVRYQLPGSYKHCLLSKLTHIKGELMTWSFVLCTVVWYNILYQINHVSKILQRSKQETSSVRVYLENFWENGLLDCQTDAREIAETLEIDRTFPAKRQGKTTLQFLYEALSSLNDIFSKLEDVYHLYGFLFSKEDMSNTIHSGTLADDCKKLEKTLHDIDSRGSCSRGQGAVHTFPDHVSSSPREMLDHKEQLLDLYGNFSIALRLLLTLPVTVASGEGIFSALKLIK